MDARSGYAKAPDGAHLAYAVSGSGTIDALHIAPWTIPIEATDDEPHVARYMRRLAAPFRFIRYDMRGVGSSDPIALGGSSVTEMAADAKAVIDASEARKVVVIADAGGGPVAIELAARHPESVRSLVIINGYACIIADRDSPGGVPRKLVEQFLAQNFDPDEKWTARGDESDDLALIAPSLRHDAALREWWVRASRRGASPASARSLLATTTGADVRPQLAHVHAPTLVLHSAHNRFVPAALGRYIADHIAGARYVELRSADHAPWGDQSDRVLDEIEEFVTGHRTGGIDRVLATVLFTDIVDSTGRAAALGDREWRGLLDRHDAIVRAEIARYGGREINTTGDGFITAFESPTQAVRAGQAMVNAAGNIAIRVGVHTGECERRGDDLAGLTVHIAARVGALAAPGEVLVSRTVRDLVAGSELRFVPRGEYELKGVPDSWQLFALAGVS
jgi:class 3 adenylate cyclase